MGESPKHFVFFSILAILITISISNLPNSFAETYEISIPEETAVPRCEEFDECYSSSYIEINVGDTIIWYNDDTAAHTVTSGTPEDGPGITDSGLFMSGESFSHTFNVEPGFVYPYFCMVHLWMTGEIFVQETFADLPQGMGSIEQEFLDVPLPELPPDFYAETVGDGDESIIQMFKDFNAIDVAIPQSFMDGNQCDLNEYGNVVCENFCYYDENTYWTCNDPCYTNDLGIGLCGGFWYTDVDYPGQVFSQELCKIDGNGNCQYYDGCYMDPSGYVFCEEEKNCYENEFGEKFCTYCNLEADGAVSCTEEMFTEDFIDPYYQDPYLEDPNFAIKNIPCNYATGFDMESRATGYSERYDAHVFLLNLGEFDRTSGSYEMDFWVYVYPASQPYDFQQYPPPQFDFVNGKATVSKEECTPYMYSYKVQGKFFTDLDFRD